MKPDRRLLTIFMGHGDDFLSLFLFPQAKEIRMLCRRTTVKLGNLIWNTRENTRLIDLLGGAGTISGAQLAHRQTSVHFLRTRQGFET
jgi:hypothetical protein